MEQDPTRRAKFVGATLTVLVGIKPGRSKNAINLKSKGVVPDTEACLDGQTLDGMALTGCDAVSVKGS